MELKSRTLLTFVLYILENVSRVLSPFSSVSNYSQLRGRLLQDTYFGLQNIIGFFNRDSLGVVECASLCDSAEHCGGFNYCDVTGNRSCEVLEVNEEPIHTGNLWGTEGCQYFHKTVSQCLNGGVVLTDNTCWCPLGYTGEFCESLIKNCEDAYYQGFYRNEVMKIQPDPDKEEFRVECRLKEGAVTRILKRRQNYTDHFEDRKWWDYKNGFWFPWPKNGFLGLEKLHSLLESSPYSHEAKVTVVFQNDTLQYRGYYGNFHVQDENQGYTVTYSGYTAGAVPLDDGFSGSGNDDSINGQPFCLTTSNECSGCAVNGSLGWWFGTGCAYVVPSAPLSSLVWPKNSVMVPVEELYIDIVANVTLG